MLCQNCGKNEVNFRYTQVINGVKKEIALCDKCAKKLGLGSLDFNMSFSNMLDDFFDMSSVGSLLPSFAKGNMLESELEKAIKEERYEDAAKIRDEIRKLN